MNDETIKDKMINYFDSQGINWKLQNAMTIFKGGIEQGKSEVLEKIDGAICSIPYERDSSLNDFIVNYLDIKQSLTSQPQTFSPAKEETLDEKQKSKGHGICGMQDDKSGNGVGGQKSKQTEIKKTTSLRAKYCDECKTKQGEEDVA